MQPDEQADAEARQEAPGASVTYSCSRANVTLAFFNVANVVGTTPTGQTVRDSDRAQVNYFQGPVG